MIFFSEECIILPFWISSQFLCGIYFPSLLAHSPPPVPTNANRAGLLHPSISDELASLPTGAAPPKPPRMKKETRESYNAYDNASRFLNIYPLFKY